MLSGRVVTEVSAVGCSLMCPGLGSSNSSTRPIALIPSVPSPSGMDAFKVKGVGGGLRDLDRRASSWRNGIGEKSGVLGADCSVEPSIVALRPADCISLWVRGGKLSQVDVTRMDLSTARRYFPTDVYCFLGSIQSSQRRWIVNGGLLVKFVSH